MNIKNIFKEIPITSSYDKWIFIIAMLFGVITGYTYLKFIDKLFLFGDIVDGLSVLVAIAVVYCILAFLIGICFIFSLLTSFLIKHIYNNHQLNIRFLILQFLFLTVGFFPYFLMPFFGLSSYSLWFVFSSVILTSVLNTFIIKYSENKSSNSDFDVVFLIIAITVFQHYPIILSIFPISDFSNKSFDEWMLFLLIPSINILMYFIYFLIIAIIPTKSFDIKIIFFIMFGVFFVSYFSLFSIKGKAPYQSLYAVRFIEKPQDSSWYLIHNDNNTSETINGMTKDDIKKYQKDLFNANDVTCDQIKKEKIKEKCKKDYFNISKKDNAFYGYMAWNLGDTKVFCPVSVDFFDGGDNKEKSKKCLVIDGKYLQLVSQELL